ncbi:MAG: hypothetical protein OSA99_11055 [Acidimicrobiales bacterium]|nr:hypothetical protein [Acidimicrobiales bacterium]
MSGRSIVFALAASIAVVLVGALANEASVVVVGLLSSLAAGILLAIKTDDTTQPMGQILFADES